MTEQRLYVTVDSVGACAELPGSIHFFMWLVEGLSSANDVNCKNVKTTAVQVLLVFLFVRQSVIL